MGSLERDDRVLDFDPAWHDALVLIHPTYAPKHATDEYVHRVIGALERAREAGRPVFHCPDDGHDPRLDPRLEGPGITEVRLFLGGCRSVKRKYLRKRTQREVDFIADRVGKPAAEVRLGFGGMYADACVYGFAEIWCRKIVTRWPDPDRENVKWRPKRPFAQGDILEKLVIS